jgi:hypothetical protein
MTRIEPGPTKNDRPPPAFDVSLGSDTGPIVYFSKNDLHVIRVLIESNVFIYFLFSEVREL